MKAATLHSRPASTSLFDSTHPLPPHHLSIHFSFLEHLFFLCANAHKDGYGISRIAIRFTSYVRCGFVEFKGSSPGTRLVILDTPSLFAVRLRPCTTSLCAIGCPP